MSIVHNDFRPGKSSYSTDHHSLIRNQTHVARCVGALEGTLTLHAVLVFMRSRGSCRVSAQSYCTDIGVSEHFIANDLSGDALPTPKKRSNNGEYPTSADGQTQPVPLGLGTDLAQALLPQHAITTD
jgi:hypothetical protein